MPRRHILPTPKEEASIFRNDQGEKVPPQMVTRKNDTRAYVLVIMDKILYKVGGDKREPEELKENQAPVGVIWQWCQRT